MKELLEAAKSCRKHLKMADNELVNLLGLTRTHQCQKALQQYRQKVQAVCAGLQGIVWEEFWDEEPDYEEE